MKIRESKSGKNTSLFVVIPKDIVSLLRIKKGDEVVITTDKDSNIIIKKI